jgi:hypothetical protein
MKGGEIVENIKIIKEVKYWPSVNKWCVAMTLPEYEGWFDNGWDKDIKKAEAIALGHVKKHLAFVREMKASSKTQELVLTL